MNVNPLLPPPRPPTRRTYLERCLSPRRLLLLLLFACGILLFQKQDALRKYAAGHHFPLANVLGGSRVMSMKQRRDCGSPAVEGYKVT